MSNAPARCGEDSIRYGGRNWGQPELSESSGLFSTGGEIDFYRRHLIHPQQGVIMEIVLLDLPMGHGDFPFQRGRQSHDDRTFNLRFGNGGIDYQSTIYGTDDPVNPYGRIGRQRNFSDLRDSSTGKVNIASHASTPARR